MQKDVSSDFRYLFIGSDSAFNCYPDDCVSIRFSDDAEPDGNPFFMVFNPLKSEDPARIFASSRKGFETTVQRPQQRKTDRYAWTGGTVSVLTLLLYFYLIYRYRNLVGMAVKSFFYKDSREKILDSQDFNIAGLFALSRLLCWMALSLGLHRTLERFYPELFEKVESWIVLAGIMLAILSSSVLQFLMVSLATFLSGNHLFFNRLRRINVLGLSHFAILSTPLLLLYAGASEKAFVPLFVPAATVVIALLLTHVIRVYRYFKTEKVSSFQWFLYLCAAEAVPWSYVFVLACKKFL